MRLPVMTPPPPQLSRPTIVAYNRKGSMDAMTGSEAWGLLAIGRDECTAMDGLCYDWCAPCLGFYDGPRAKTDIDYLSTVSTPTVLENWKWLGMNRFSPKPHVNITPHHKNISKESAYNTDPINLMDPYRNAALQDAKLQLLFDSSSCSSAPSNNSSNHHHHPTQPSNLVEADTRSMPPPPAYHSVVDPNAPIPNLHDPYAAEEEDKDEDETPEVTINAATQIRGHGNIISIPQMDSLRIAQMVALMLGTVPQIQPTQFNPAAAAAAAQQQGQQGTAQGAPAQPIFSSRKPPHVNITVNCGATIIGDRNIVGPGLGDIARHMQAANQSRAAQMQSQNVNLRAGGQPPQPQAYPFQNHMPTGAQVPTPPMSRSSSMGSSGAKRKAEDEAEGREGKRRVIPRADGVVWAGSPAASRFKALVCIMALFCSTHGLSAVRERAVPRRKTVDEPNNDQMHTDTQALGWTPLVMNGAVGWGWWVGGVVATAGKGKWGVTGFWKV
ncbi:hypothetical protein BS50DRAFT_582440 [Corynespora cassiicola Philippines]|uniref:Uncharacterized protein n=1 Tax=Corynespora cassiicola Philippines TaxID=1448308 RepID=A0A2T2P5E9_CORCC|nr:hypothetical protein BS50DRAFT_582440 [Corynespora cassiicola Philippines]